MLREGLYAAYTWRVRHFKEGETNETTIRFTPDGRPYGFVERLKEDAPGAGARRRGGAADRARTDARARWSVDLSQFALVEQGQERRPGGRVDHTFTYERASPTLERRTLPPAARRLRRSPDRGHALHQDSRGVHAGATRACDRRTTPSASDRSSAWRSSTSSAASASACSSCCGSAACSGGTAAVWGVAVGLLQALAALNEFPLHVDDLRHGDPALDVPRAADRDARRDVRRLLGVLRAVVHGGRDADAPRVRTASAVLARLVERSPAARSPILGRTVGGYLLVVGVLRLRRRCSTWS